MRALALVCLLLAAGACGSVGRPGAPSPSPSRGPIATVSGHLSWPDCAGSTCPPVGGVAVHFWDASANRTYTAVSDRSGGYAIELPPGTYRAIAGDADRSPYQRQLAVRAGDAVTLDLSISLPTGA
ncbi:MAG TPA: carboxypeptidase-like regulatory domain-containing protein [Candidatus Dormibacteraeota bacterium]|nr:carboxypeptidase-like regulatory domain-containing protein [Candidatus Dormibacteraeota bacterium]